MMISQGDKASLDLVIELVIRQLELFPDCLHDNPSMKTTRQRSMFVRM